MPDAHFGKGATIGSVIPTKGGIIPAAVGVDIGCGLNFIRFNMKKEDLGDLKALRNQIQRDIPRGEGRQGSRDPDGRIENNVNLALKVIESLLPPALDPDQYSPYWRTQVGTLGGGNHFIQLDTDEEGYVWASIHSGSRGVGLRIADHYIKAAQGLGQQLEDPDLAWLEEETELFDGYIAGMTWAQHYAFHNRRVMMILVLDAIMTSAGEFQILEWRDCHHNYTEKETHFGEELWVTRKGAIRAQVGDRAIIPGSMASGSYIVEGRGNTEAFNSAPHGAGRQMSRRQAKKHLSFEELKEQMAGIECNVTESMLDEAPGAYKDLDLIMADSGPLVEIKHKLTPILNIKG